MNGNSDKVYVICVIALHFFIDVHQNQLGYEYILQFH